MERRGRVEITMKKGFRMDKRERERERGGKY